MKNGSRGVWDHWELKRLSILIPLKEEASCMDLLISK